MDKAVIACIARDRDTVASVPHEFLGFRHLDKLVYITKDGHILINPNLGSDNVVDEEKIKELLTINPSLAESESEQYADDTTTKCKKRYEKLICKIPGPLRDHMPEFYLEPLIKLMEREAAAEESMVTEESSG